MKYENQARIKRNSARLRELLKVFQKDYDYILIDSPTNWTFFSQSCVYAADVILIPTKHNNFASIKNAAKVIKDFITEVKNYRTDGGPIALPIFFNEHKQTDASMVRAHSEIKNILTLNKVNVSVWDPELLPYYYPKASKANFDTTIFTIPEYEVVSSAPFSRVPAVFKHKNVAEYYLGLAKEYLLYG